MLRYRYYGEPQDPLAAHMNFRAALPGYKYSSDAPPVKADYLIFGKLDCTEFDLGPFSDDNAADIARKWSFLRTRPPKRSAGDFFIRIGEAMFTAPIDAASSIYNYEFEISLLDEIMDPYDLVSEKSYGSVVDRLGAPARYMSGVLEMLYKAETLAHTGYADPYNPTTDVSPISCSLRNKVKDLDEASGGVKKRHEIWVEIGNEPNVFPAIPPDLYAEYYGKYYDYLKAEIDYINDLTGREEVNAIVLKLVPGGMLLMEGLPAKLLAFIKKGVRIKFELWGTDYLNLDTKTFTDVLAYWKEFAAVVDQQERIVVGQKNSQAYNGRGHRGTPTAQDYNIYQNVGLKNRVNAVNLHFYPYFGPHADTVKYPKTDIPKDPLNLLDRFVPRALNYRQKSLASTQKSLSKTGYEEVRFYYDVEVVKSQLAYLRYVSVSMARMIDTNLPNNPQTRDLWLTELGNMTSPNTTDKVLAMQAVASTLMAPLFQVLHAGYLNFRDDSLLKKPIYASPKADYQNRTRWYWYKNSGYDKKVDQLQAALPALGWWQVADAILEFLFIGLPGGGLKISDMSNEVKAIIEAMAADWERVEPPTSLEYNGDYGALQNKLSPIGEEYLCNAGHDIDTVISEGLDSPAIVLIETIEGILENRYQEVFR